MMRMLLWSSAFGMHFILKYVCMLLQRRPKLAGEMSVTHNEAVMCCAHNPNFGHVITCSERSVSALNKHTVYLV